MSTPAERPRLMTVQEFLAHDFSVDELRYELIDGVPTALNPPIAPHARMVIVLGMALERRLRRPCAVYAGGGARRDDDPYNYRIPDLAISCSRSREYWVEVPEVAVEILSPSDTKGILDLRAWPKT